MTQETGRLDRIEGQLTLLIHLVRTGGKESRVMESVPAWTAEDSDGECEFTGTKLPTKKLVKLGTLRVHPGAAAYADERGIEDLATVPETVIPEDYLAVPFNIEFRKVYRAPTTVVWSKAEIGSYTRPAMMYLCGQLHVQQILEERGVARDLADFRRQTNGWLTSALHAIADGKEIPDPLPLGVVRPGRKAKVAKTPMEKLVDASEGSESKNASTGKVEAQPSPTNPRKASKKKSGKKEAAKAVKSGGSKTKPTATSGSSGTKAKKTGKKSSKSKPKTAVQSKSAGSAKVTKTDSAEVAKVAKKKTAKKSSASTSTSSSASTKKKTANTKPAKATKRSSKKSGKKEAAKKSSSSQALAPKKKTAKKKPAKKKKKGKK